ncbi:hypothetical protein [Candidatus Manganitrophus noduliformans]|nr:hypothetical protein [Candidatus Manganitrophus noduliformans]
MRSLGKKIEVHWIEAGYFDGAAQVKQLCQERMLQFAHAALGSAER